MLLGDWLERNKMSRSAFANAIGTSGSTISTIALYTAGAGKELSLRIEEATRGEVSRTEAMYPYDYIEKDKHGNIQKRTFPRPPKVLPIDCRQKIIDAKGTARAPRKKSHKISEMKEFQEMAEAIQKLQMELASMKREEQAAKTTKE